MNNTNDVFTSVSVTNHYDTNPLTHPLSIGFRRGGGSFGSDVAVVAAAATAAYKRLHRPYSSHKYTWTTQADASSEVVVVISF